MNSQIRGGESCKVHKVMEPFGLIYSSMITLADNVTDADPKDDA